MVHPNKKQKVEEDSTSITTCTEDLIFNSDILPKIISYLPSIDVLNLAITCKRFGISDNHKTSSLIEKSASIAIQDFATDELLGALPNYDGEGALADYHYLQLLKAPLAFDQLVGGAVYVNEGDKSKVTRTRNTTNGYWGTAFSNNILRAGKHYVTFEVTMESSGRFWLGVMRPGQANENASGTPLLKSLYQNFSQSFVHGDYTSNVYNCCMYSPFNGECSSSTWDYSHDLELDDTGNWEGMETLHSDGEIGMLLDLDEGTLSVYKNGRFLGVMKRGLAGPYCWAASMRNSGSPRVTIKRGTIPQFSIDTREE